MCVRSLAFTLCFLNTQSRSLQTQLIIINESTTSNESSSMPKYSSHTSFMEDHPKTTGQTYRTQTNKQLLLLQFSSSFTDRCTSNRWRRETDTLLKGIFLFHLTGTSEKLPPPGSRRNHIFALFLKQELKQTHRI